MFSGERFSGALTVKVNVSGSQLSRNGWPTPVHVPLLVNVTTDVTTPGTETVPRAAAELFTVHQERRCSIDLGDCKGAGGSIGAGWVAGDKGYIRDDGAARRYVEYLTFPIRIVNNRLGVKPGLTVRRRNRGEAVDRGGEIHNGRSGDSIVELQCAIQNVFRTFSGAPCSSWRRTASARILCTGAKVTLGSRDRRDRRKERTSRQISQARVGGRRRVDSHYWLRVVTSTAVGHIDGLSQHRRPRSWCR